MEAINYITRWVNWLYLIIPVAAGCMITYFALKKGLTSDQDTINDCKKKIKNTLYGSVIGLTISGFISIVKAFYI